MVRAARDAGVVVYLNADHTYSLDGCKEVIDAGFDSVIFDGSHLPLEENIATTKSVVEYARSKGTGVLVEGEIGRIGTSSKLLAAPPARTWTRILLILKRRCASFEKAASICSLLLSARCMAG